jgi:hypothetical protein
MGIRRELQQYLLNRPKGSRGFPKYYLGYYDETSSCHIFIANLSKAKRVTSFGQAIFGEVFGSGLKNESALI